MAEAALVGLIALSAGGSIYSGISANQSAKEQAGQLDRQAALAQEEARIEADRQSDERRRFIADQKMAYVANGIGISGTPLVTFENSYNEYQKEIDATIRAGDANADYLRSEAKVTRRNGRAALIGGVTQAASTVASGVLAGKNAKVF
jgi:hypothetical protein